MLNRRSLLFGAGILAMSRFLAGCNSQSPTLRVQLLKDSIPPQLIQEFQRRVAQGTGISIARSEQFKELWTLLESWKPSQKPAQTGGFSLPFEIPFFSPQTEPIADLISCGDFWLAAAIQHQLIQPFPANTTLAGQPLPSLWQALVSRDRQGLPVPQSDVSQSDVSQSELWGIPYRWGCLAIAYNRDKIKHLGWSSQTLAKFDWTDLWRPELQNSIALPDSPRLVIGLALKKLNQSVNLGDLTQVPRLTAELQALHQQVKFYSSDAYLQPLILDDLAIAVGWSTEILPTVKRNPSIAMVIPPSGSILTADLWVRPTQSPQLDNNSRRTRLLQDWLAFYWQPEVATQLALLSFAASPVAVTNGQQGAASLMQPTSALFQRSEFLLPLSADASAAYQHQWLGLRQTSRSSHSMPPTPKHPN